MVGSFFTGLINEGKEVADGFLGSVTSSLQSGVEKVAENVLPNWVANQLDVQSAVITAEPTYFRNGDLAALNGATLKDADLDVKTQTSVDKWTLYGLAAIAVVGAIVIIKA